MSSNNLLTLMDQFFDDAIRPIGPVLSRSFGSIPAINVVEHKDRFDISLTIPGIDANKVKVELHEKVLNISYDHEEETEDKNKKGEILRQEYSYFSFSRSLALPKNVDESTISAKASKGILNITVKKLPESQPKTVEIKIEKE